MPTNFALCPTYLVLGFEGAAAGEFRICGNACAVEGSIREMLDNPNIKSIRVIDIKSVNRDLYWDVKDVTYKKVTFDPDRGMTS